MIPGDMNIDEPSTTTSTTSPTIVANPTPTHTSPRKPPALVLPTISCPEICEQGPSIPSSPTITTDPNGLITADLMQRIQMFSQQYDTARLSPMYANYATSDLGSSARSSFSTSSIWTDYRERSTGFDEHGKELISPFDCDTQCSVSPAFSLSPNSFNHFTFDTRSVSSLCHSTNHLNQLLTVGAAFELSRERSRSESDMQPAAEEVTKMTHSTISVPCYGKKSLHKFSPEIKRSSSTPPPTTSERDEIEERRAASRLENKKDIEATNLLVSNWARDQLYAIQNANMYMVNNLLSAQKSVEEPVISPAPITPVKVIPKPISVSSENLIVAAKDSNNAMTHVCQICSQAFSVHDRLAKHIASRHRSCTLDDSSKVHKCNMCSKSFSRSDMLTRHMRLHTGAKPYSCPTCNQVFSRSDHLSTHLRTHTGEKPYACPLCSYSASRRDMISRHMRTHALTDNLDVSTPISQLSIRSATASPLPPKTPTIIEIGSGELSAFKPISSTSNHLSVSSPFQQLSLSTPSSPVFPPNFNRQSSFDQSSS